MGTELLSKENFKNPKLDPKGSEKSLSDPQYSNVDLNKVQKNIFNKKKKENLYKYFK